MHDVSLAITSEQNRLEHEGGGGFVKVLFEDSECIAVFKPAGQPVQPDDSKDASLYDDVRYYLKQKHHIPGKPYLALVHRLDRPVSGVVLFAKNSEAAARLSIQLERREAIKTYYALVHGMPPTEQSEVAHYLTHAHESNTATAHIRQVDSGRLSRLSYKVLEHRGPFSLLKINLITGRPHQIRAQLSAIGCPIVGDVKYGAPQALPDRSIMLSAGGIIFKGHARGAQPVVVNAPVLNDLQKKLQALVNNS